MSDQLIGKDPYYDSTGDEETGGICPVCKWHGEPEKDETWNGIRGPGARVIAVKYNCPSCGVMFLHIRGWGIIT